MGARGTDAVNFWQRGLDFLREDRLLRRIVKNSGYLLSSSGAGAVLAFIQSILAVRMVGVAGWGLIATITTFASNVNRLLSFRMNEVVVQRMHAALADERPVEAAAAVKMAFLVETGTSVLAYSVLFALAGWAARVFAKDPLAAPLFAFYGLTILGNLVTQTATGVLQALDKFDRLARIGFGQSLITAGVIFSLYGLWLWQPEAYAGRLLMLVLAAYLLGKFYYGASLAIRAVCEANAALGPNWRRVPLASLPRKRDMLVFALHTNLNGTVNLFTRDNIPLYLAALLSSVEVGYVKIAQALINPILLIVNPFIWPTYAEITRAVAQKQWETTRRVLRRVSMVTGSLVALLGGGLALTGWWLIPALYGAEARPAYPALLILLLGYGFASIFQWNRPLLLALDKPSWPVMVSAAVGLLEISLIFGLVPRYGYLMMTAILSFYFIASIGLMVWLGLRLIKEKVKAAA